MFSRFCAFSSITNCFLSRTMLHARWRQFFLPNKQGETCTVHTVDSFAADPGKWGLGGSFCFNDPGKNRTTSTTHTHTHTLTHTLVSARWVQAKPYQNPTNRAAAWNGWRVSQDRLASCRCCCCYYCPHQHEIVKQNSHTICWYMPGQ